MAYHIKILRPNQASRSQSLGVGIIVVREKLVITDGRRLTIRRDTRPEQIRRNIYRVLRVHERILSPIKRWTNRPSSPQCPLRASRSSRSMRSQYV